jgi:hypothetical protein
MSSRCDVCKQQLCNLRVDGQIIKHCPKETIKIKPKIRIIVEHKNMEPVAEITNKLQCDVCGEMKISRKINGIHMLECPNVLDRRKEYDYYNGIINIIHPIEQAKNTYHYLNNQKRC